MNTAANAQYAPTAVLSTAGSWDSVARAYDRLADGVLSADKRLQLTQFVVSPQEYPELHKLALIAVSSERKTVVLHSAEQDKAL